ncbi:Bcl-2-like protein 15 [Oryzias melastigma]|uniref:Bcl-2-like protein 15 n=1 Tax=Oryzias melastigma TaxID=30732 RepID=A0A834F4D7_ORYME|nr:Bcl-2-like protein 15 [Oryzias melastigma]
MAPVDILIQTDQVVHFLLADEEEIQARAFEDGIESDGPGSGEEDDFDPVVVAGKLRAIGDALDEEAHLVHVLTDLKKAAAKEAVEAAFSHGVEALCETHSAKAPEVAPEIQLIKASVALGVYVAKKAPELKSKVHGALTSFLTTRVGGWVAQQGGWDKVRDL